MDICGMIWALFHWPEIKGKCWPWFFNLTSKANMVGGTFFEARLLCAICSLVTNKADIYRLCIFVTFFWFRLRTFGGHIFAQIWWLEAQKILRDRIDCLKRLHKEHKNILLNNIFFKSFWIKAARISNEAWSVKWEQAGKSLLYGSGS